MLGRVGSSVGKLGIISANRGPNFSYTGTNTAFQSALTEAAYTGLVAGFSAPAYPQYWLRGVSYPSFLSVPGATCTRTGNRAGLDAAVVYAANVPRVAPGSGLRVFGSGTNLIRSSETADSNVTPWSKGAQTTRIGQEVFPNGRTATIYQGDGAGANSFVAQSITLVSGTVYTITFWARLVSGTKPTGGALLSMETAPSGPRATLSFSASALDATARLFTITFTATGSGPCTAFFLADANNTAQIAISTVQFEQSPFATDYIPNPNTGASSSAGADDVQVAASVLPATSGTLVFLVDLPNQAYQAGTSQRVLNGNFPVIINDQTFVSAVNGAGGSAAVAGLPTSGARRIAVLYTPGAATRMSVNGSAVVVGTDVGEVYSTAAIQIGNRAALDRALNGGLGVLAIYRATPSDAQLQAMSAL